MKTQLVMQGNAANQSRIQQTRAKADEWAANNQ
jgi:hypothetical protein